MLKIFYIIITLSALAKSQIAVQWICKETQTMGNCSSVPKISDLLQVISDNSDNYEYADLHYCPFSIAERHADCMRTYFKSCYPYLSDFQQNIFFVYIPPAESPETLCTKGRPYKKEFREHMSCTNSFLSVDDEWEEHLENFEMQFAQQLEDMSYSDKCRIVSGYWNSLTTKIRKQCGTKTEKFARQVLSYIWPISMSPKLCSDLSYFDP